MEPSRVKLPKVGKLRCRRLRLEALERGEGQRAIARAGRIAPAEPPDGRPVLAIPPELNAMWWARTRAKEANAKILAWSAAEGDFETCTLLGELTDAEVSRRAGRQTTAAAVWVKAAGVFATRRTWMWVEDLARAATAKKGRSAYFLDLSAAAQEGGDGPAEADALPLELDEDEAESVDDSDLDPDESDDPDDYTQWWAGCTECLRWRLVAEATYRRVAPSHVHFYCREEFGGGCGEALSVEEAEWPPLTAREARARSGRRSGRGACAR